MARSNLHPGPSRQSGIALVAVLVIVAIVSLITYELGMGQQIWLRQAQNLKDKSQAELVRRGAEKFAILILDRDGRDNSVDHLGESWAVAMPVFPAEGGKVALAVEDMQGRFNINSLLKNGQYDTEFGAVFRRLLVNSGASADLQNTLLDWIDADNDFRVGGAEDDYYSNMENGYRTANQALSSVQELLLIKGWEQKEFDRIRELVTALPDQTAININTAPAEVLAALFEGMPIDEARRIVDYRKGRPFTKPSDIMSAVSGTYPAPKESLMTTESHFFQVTTAVEFGRYFRMTQALVSRPGPTQPSRLIGHDRPLIRLAVEKTGE